MVVGYVNVRIKRSVLAHVSVLEWLGGIVGAGLLLSLLGWFLAGGERRQRVVGMACRRVIVSGSLALRSWKARLVGSHFRRI